MLMLFLYEMWLTGDQWGATSTFARLSRRWSARLH